MAFSNYYQNSFFQELMSGLDNSQYISTRELENEPGQETTGADAAFCQNSFTLLTAASNSQFPLTVSISDRALLPRPPAGSVSFKQAGGGQCPLDFTIEESAANEDEDDGEEVYDELVETPQNHGSESASIEDETGPNRGELHAFYVARAQQFQELADPLTIDAVPEADLLEIMTRAMQSLRRRHLL